MPAAPQKGLLLIPDISGFTEFVNVVELSHSEHIIADLLELLINLNHLELELCEIEGDALFFYRVGPAPTRGGTAGAGPDLGPVIPCASQAAPA